MPDHGNRPASRWAIPFRARGVKGGQVRQEAGQTVGQGSMDSPEAQSSGSRQVAPPHRVGPGAIKRPALVRQFSQANRVNYNQKPAAAAPPTSEVLWLSTTLILR